MINSYLNIFIKEYIYYNLLKLGEKSCIFVSALYQLQKNKASQFFTVHHAALVTEELIKSLWIMIEYMVQHSFIIAFSSVGFKSKALWKLLTKHELRSVKPVSAGGQMRPSLRGRCWLVLESVSFDSLWKDPRLTWKRRVKWPEAIRLYCRWKCWQNKWAVIRREPFPTISTNSGNNFFL